MTPLCVVAALLAAAAPTPKDVAPRSPLYFEQQTETRVDGQASGPVLRSRAWIDGKKMRLEREDAAAPAGAALIVRLDQGRALRIDPEHRTAWQLDLERELTQSRLEMGVAGDLLGARVRAVPLKTSRQIAGFECQGHRLETEAGSIEVWMTTALPIDAQVFAEFLEWLGADESMGSYLDALRRLSGFPLETRARLEVSGRQVETLSTVTTVRVGPVAESLFEPPPGYRLESAPAADVSAP